MRRRRRARRRVRTRAARRARATPTTTASVFTLAGPAPDDAVTAVRRLAGSGRATRLDRRRTTACIRASARSTSCPFVALGGTDAERAQAADAARAFGDVVGRARTACRCSSTTTPTRSVATFRASGATRSRAARPDFGPRAPHPRSARPRSARAGRSSRSTACSSAATSTIAQRDRPRGARARRRAAGRARARASCSRQSRPAAGVDEPRRPRPHRRRGRRACAYGSSRGARHRRRRGRARRPRAARRARPVLGRLPAWAGIDAAAAIEARVGHGPRLLSATRRHDPSAATARRSRRWRGRGGRARAGGGCGGAPARTCRPRCRTSRRAAARTRGTRAAPRSRRTRPSPPWWRRPARERTGRGRRRGSWLAPASAGLRRVDVRARSTISRIGCPLV